MGVEITRFNIRYKLMVTNLVKYTTTYKSHYCECELIYKLAF